MAYVKIPMATESGAFIAYLKIADHEFGDPHSVTLTFPKDVDGKIHLPRHFFSAEILGKLTRPDD